MCLTEHMSHDARFRCLGIYDSIYLPTGADSGDACWGSISISAVGVSGTWAKSPARKSAAGSDAAKIIFYHF